MRRRGTSRADAFYVGTYRCRAVFHSTFCETIHSDADDEQGFRRVRPDATYHVNDRLGLIAGLRYTKQKLTDHAGANIYDPTSVAQDGSTRENNVSGKSGSAVQTEFRIYGLLHGDARLQRSAGGRRRKGAPTMVIAAEIPLAFELGIKGSLLDGRLGLDANVFSTKVEGLPGPALQHPAGRRPLLQS